MGGIVVAEGPGADSAIAALPTAVTAFVGRTLRGPVNQPVAIGSFAEFHQVFGGLWQPSSLSYAVEQFFEHGGERAVVVRVVNGGAAATITLPCGPQSLTLVARSPGSRESVCRDGIPLSPHARWRRSLRRECGSRELILGEGARGLDGAPPAIQVPGRVALAELR